MGYKFAQSQVGSCGRCGDKTESLEQLLEEESKLYGDIMRLPSHAVSKQPSDHSSFMCSWLIHDITQIRKPVLCISSVSL